VLHRQLISLYFSGGALSKNHVFKRVVEHQARPKIQDAESKGRECAGYISQSQNMVPPLACQADGVAEIHAVAFYLPILAQQVMLV
jgi:hypothetical protein